MNYLWHLRHNTAHVLIDEISQMRHLKNALSPYTGKKPSEASAEALALANQMLEVGSIPEIIKRAANVHDFCNIANPDDSYPTDHFIDLVSSCASILRFGFEVPFRSRHAAAASDHVWKQVYGVSKHDALSNEWSKSFAFSKLQMAILRLVPTPQPLRN